MDKDRNLFVSANWIMLLGIVGALIASQWKHGGVPAIGLAVILLLVVLKSRLIILDFMSLRGASPLLARGLIAWTTVFALAGFARAILPV